jgi:O-antigen/teichoic acid export membrane protein
MFMRRAVEFGWFAASTASFQATRLIAGLIAAAMLAPEDFAIWGIFLVALNYSNYLNLGLLSAANREIPILNGRKLEAVADEVEGYAHGAMVVLFALVGVSAVTAYALTGHPVVLVGGLAVAIQQLYLVHQVSLKARLRLNQASTSQAALAVTFPLASLPLLGTLGVTALLVGQALAYGASVAIGLAAWPPTSPRFSFRYSISLVVQGLPIMLGGLLFAVLSTLDRWFVLTFYGTAALGQYTLAALVSSVFLFVAVLVAQQSYPRLALGVGKGLPKSRLLAQARIQALLAVGLVAPISVAIVAAAPIVVPRLFPQYGSSVPSLQILAGGMLTLTAATAYTNLLVAVGRAWLYLGLVMASILVQAVVAFASVALGGMSTGIAVAAAASYTALLALSYAAARL